MKKNITAKNTILSLEVKEDQKTMYLKLNSTRGRVVKAID